MRELRATRKGTGVRPVVDTGTESLVQQQFKDEVDVNTIIRRFGLGQAPAYASGVYGDFTGVTDYWSAREAINRAEAGFLGLPAEARDKFDNDPGKFLRYAESVTEDDLVEYLGLRKLPVTTEGAIAASEGKTGPLPPPAAPGAAASAAT